MLQDVGATFGPTKVEHDEWAAVPIWADEGRCVVSLENLPYTGGRFTPIQISEGGRPQLVAGKLTQLSEGSDPRAVPIGAFSRPGERRCQRRRHSPG